MPLDITLLNLLRVYFQRHDGRWLHIPWHSSWSKVSLLLSPWMWAEQTGQRGQLCQCPGGALGGGQLTFPFLIPSLSESSHHVSILRLKGCFYKKSASLETTTLWGSPMQSHTLDRTHGLEMLTKVQTSKGNHGSSCPTQPPAEYEGMNPMDLSSWALPKLIRHRSKSK